VEIARRWPAAWKAEKRRRALLALARPGGEPELAEALVREEWAEREADARYWQPLKAEIERLRHERRGRRLTGRRNDQVC